MYRTDSVPWKGWGGSLSLSAGGQSLPVSQTLGREAHSWLLRLLLMPEIRFEKQIFLFKNWKGLM